MHVSFKEKLHKWAIKAVEYSHEIATGQNSDFNLSFYAFQDEPKEKPEILFLGINPGGSYSYSDQYDNPSWDIQQTGRMTTERFIQANPFFKNIPNFSIWKNLKKSFVSPRMQEKLENSMYMNLVYFNTPNLDNFLRRKDGHEVFRKQKEFSLDLILNIIKPKIIICLGTSGCFDTLNLKSPEVLYKSHKRLLVKGSLNSLPVFGIPHPSGSYTGNNEWKKIGELLDKNI